MTRRGHSAGREARKKEKRQARARQHTDKYESRILESKLDQLARHFNGEESDDE